MAVDIPSFTFNDGTVVPSIGMGCWMGKPGGGDRVEEMCKLAIKAGYRHFDTASGYQTEEALGKAIRASGIPRSEFYIVTKLGFAHPLVKEEFERSLAQLDLGYIDLYLMHWPQTPVKEKFVEGDSPYTTPMRGPDEWPTIIDTWKDMEKLVATGKVKSIGVSNFGLSLMEKLLPHCTILPVTNQVEIHPCLPQHALKAYCDAKGIVLTAYSPVGQFSDELFKDQTINALAEKQAASPAQVLLSWGVQRGTIVIPKSENEGRMTANITVIKLSDEDMGVLDTFHMQPGKHRSLLKYHNEEKGSVFGWTYDQLGWGLTTGGYAV